MARFMCVRRITWLMSVSFLVIQVYGVDVSLEYSASDVTDDQMPEEVNVTLNTESSALIKLHLRRTHHINLNIPLYTLTTDDAGFYERKKFKSTNRKDLSFYQDLENQAVFQISRPTEDTSKKSKLKMKGEFHMQGSTYAFNTNNKSQRKPRKPTTTTEASVSYQDNDVYTLVQHNKLTFDMLDSRVPPPEKKKSLRKNQPVYDQMPKHKNRANRTRLDLDALSWLVPLDRQRRDVITDYYIDIIAVIDYKLYIHFLSLAGQRSDQALQDVLEHYAFVFNGIDMLYKGIEASYKIHIRLCQVYVIQTLLASNFVESHKIGDMIDSDVVLEAFRNFSSTSGQNIVAGYDHAMLFTAYDLTSFDSNFRISSSTVGIAYIGTMCRTDGMSTSVIEDRKGYSTIGVAAHELGHSLSAQHDGVNNVCSYSDRYIMAASNSKETFWTVDHPWQFSPCSVRYFTNFLRNATLSSSRGYTCLVNEHDVDPGIPDVSYRLLGQVVKPDQQCKDLHGNKSVYCRSMDSVTVSDICHSMYCLDPDDPLMCIQNSALMGTSCGDGKICLNGVCVNDAHAPHVDDQCIFGDEPNAVFRQMSCASNVRDFNGYCYNSIFRETCCSSCKEVSRYSNGCEYGDHYTDCISFFCYRYPWDIKQNCCSTCGSGSLDFKTTLRTSSREVHPGCTIGQPNLYPAMCTNRNICEEQPWQCCDYCSNINRATPTTTRRRTTTELKRIQHFGCLEGDPDFSPYFCTSPSVCHTHRAECCNYCSKMNSAVSTAMNNSLYFFVLYLILMHCKNIL